MTNLVITERKSGSVTILDLKGNIRIGEGNVHLHETLRGLMEKGEKNILLNLAGVTHIDSTGLGEIIACHITVKKNNGVMKLLHLTKRVRELMVITKLLTVFYVFTSESQAIESFSPFFKGADGNEAHAVSA
jgi:anti-sigma B factor antagonist